MKKKLRRLVVAMLGTFEELGKSATARADARTWARHYRRKAAKIMPELFKEVKR